MVKREYAFHRSRNMKNCSSLLVIRKMREQCFEKLRQVLSLPFPISFRVKLKFIQRSTKPFVIWPCIYSHLSQDNIQYAPSFPVGLLCICHFLREALPVSSLNCYPLPPQNLLLPCSLYLFVSNAFNHHLIIPICLLTPFLSSPPTH